MRYRRALCTGLTASNEGWTLPLFAVDLRSGQWIECAMPPLPANVHILWVQVSCMLRT